MQPFGLTKHVKPGIRRQNSSYIKINENNRQNRNTRRATTRYRINQKKSNFCIVQNKN